MTKSEAIRLVNSYLERQILNGNNTSYSNINARRAVWWFNIPVHKFSDDVHLLLAKTNGFIWIKIPKNAFQIYPNLE